MTEDYDWSREVYRKEYWNLLRADVVENYGDLDLEGIDRTPTEEVVHQLGLAEIVMDQAWGKLEREGEVTPEYIEDQANTQVMAMGLSRSGPGF